MENKVVEKKPSKTDLAKVGGRTVLNPKSSITYQNCEELEAMFNECISQRKTEIILDCKTVSFMDSSALELLLRMHDDLKNRGGILKLSGLNSVCRDILLSTRLINMLHVYTDIQEAITSVS